MQSGALPPLPPPPRTSPGENGLLMERILPCASLWLAPLCASHLELFIFASVLQTICSQLITVTNYLRIPTCLGRAVIGPRLTCAHHRGTLKSGLLTPSTSPALLACWMAASCGAGAGLACAGLCYGHVEMPRSGFFVLFATVTLSTG